MHEIESETSVYTNLYHKYLCKLIAYQRHGLMVKHTGEEITCSYLVMSLYVGG
jgi:hypothetical protein